MFDLEILYEDRDIIAVYKPAGVPVQTKRIGTPDIENAVRNHIASEDNGQVPYLGMIHRLDQPVEGITLFAKNKRAAAVLSKELQENKMKKIYLAVTDGIPKQEEGVLIDWILFDRKKNLSEIVKENKAGAKKAELTYKLIDKVNGMSKIEIYLKTGRHHQIRVQMANAGMPLVGDHKYRAQDDGGRFPALCASELEFKHPRTDKMIHLKVLPKNKEFVLREKI